MEKINQLKQPITNENYFTEPHYMSVSAWKKYDKCEVDGLKGFDNTTKSDALLFGSYVDAYVEGTLEDFMEKNPEMFSTRGESKGKLKATYSQIDEICNFIDKDELIQKFLGGEKQTIMLGEIGGVPFKIKMDSYIPDVLIADLKVMRGVTDRFGQFYDFITPYGYDVQLACYQEIVRQNTGKQLPTYIVAVTKETPINSVIVQIPQTILDKALYRVESTIDRIYKIKTKVEEPVGCGVCPSCIAKRTSTPLISMNQFLEFN
jgi:hypothetical protein